MDLYNGTSSLNLHLSQYSVRKPEEGTGWPAAGVSRDCMLLDMVLQSNSSPLEGQWELLLLKLSSPGRMIIFCPFSTFVFKASNRPYTVLALLSILYPSSSVQVHISWILDTSRRHTKMCNSSDKNITNRFLSSPRHESFPQSHGSEWGAVTQSDTHSRAGKLRGWEQSWAGLKAHS